MVTFKVNIFQILVFVIKLISYKLLYYIGLCLLKPNVNRKKSKLVESQKVSEIICFGFGLKTDLSVYVLYVQSVYSNHAFLSLTLALILSQSQRVTGRIHESSNNLDQKYV